jgi:hypothetical protein
MEDYLGENAPARLPGRKYQRQRSQILTSASGDAIWAFDSRWVPPVGGALSRRTSTSTRRCDRHQRCNDWVTKPSA